MRGGGGEPTGSLGERLRRRAGRGDSSASGGGQVPAVLRGPELPRGDLADRRREDEALLAAPDPELDGVPGHELLELDPECFHLLHLDPRLRPLLLAALRDGEDEVALLDPRAAPGGL